MKDAPLDRGSNVRRTFSLDVVGTLSAACLSSILALLTGVLVARELGPAGKGAITLAVLVFSEFPLVLSLGFEIAVIYYGGKGRYSIPALASSSMGFSLLAGGTGSLIALLLFSLAVRDRIPAELTWPIVLMACAIPPNMFTRILRNLIRVSGRTVEERFLVALQTLSTLGLVGLALWRGLGLTGSLYAYTLGELLSGGAAIILALHWGLIRRGPTFAPSIWKSLITYGFKIQAGMLLQHLNYRLDTYIITFFLGGPSVGLYSVAVSMAEWLWMVPEVVGPALMQRVATRSELDANRFMPPLLRLTSAMLLVGVATWALVGSWVIRRLYGEAFAASYVALLLLLPGIWSLGLWKSLMHDLSVRGYPSYLTWTSAVGVFFTIILNFALVPRWGIAGASVASTGAYTAAFLVALVLYVRVTKVKVTDLLVPRLADFSDMLTRLRGLPREIRRGRPVPPAPEAEAAGSEES